MAPIMKEKVSLAVSAYLQLMLLLGSLLLLFLLLLLFHSYYHCRCFYLLLLALNTSNTSLCSQLCPGQHPQEGVVVLCESSFTGNEGVSGVSASIRVTNVTSTEQLVFECSASNSALSNVTTTANVSIQGRHESAPVILMVVSDHTAQRCSERISADHIRGD